jgi:hypothetical protein
VPLVNWSGGAVKNLTVAVDGKVAEKSVKLASGREVKFARENGTAKFTFDLDVADALVLR